MSSFGDDLIAAMSEAAAHAQPQFGILDLTGSITIADPAAFLERLAHGFGRAKSFGCGLMMVRRDHGA